MKRIIASLIVAGLPLWAASCATSRAAEEVTAPPSKVVLAVAMDDATPTPPTTAPTAPITPAAPAKSAATGALPPGHPDISSMGKSPMGKQPAGGALPEGHPDISSMMGQKPQGAQQPQQPQQPQQFTALEIRAVQGTSGGPAVGADEVTVEIYDRGQSVGKIDTKLNADGVAKVGNVPVGSTYQPLVIVRHQGIAYQAVGEPITASPEPITVTVFEPTDQPVAWEVKMRHLVLQPTSEGVQVMDVLAIENASDRAYVGSGGSSDGAKATTFELPLPAGAADVQFMGGFDNCCTKIESGKVVNTMAIVPGTTQYQLAYTIPFANGQAEITAAAPAITKNLIIIAPEDGTTITAQGLDAGTANMGGGQTRYFKANSVPANEAVKLTVSGTPTAAPAKAAAGMGGRLGSRLDVQRLTKGVAAVGGLVVFLVGGMMLVRKSMTRRGA